MTKMLLPQNETVVVLINSLGERYWLYGGRAAGKQGVYLLEGPEGFIDPEMDLLWSETARGIGAEFRGRNIQKREMDLPLMVSAKTAAGFRAIDRKFFSGLQTQKASYLGFFTTSTGWRWVEVRAKDINLAWGQDPARTSHCRYNVLLVAGQPLFRSTNFRHRWDAQAGPLLTNHGTLHLRNFGDENVWPSFYLGGPGTIKLTYGNQVIELPELKSGEEVLIHTEPSRQRIRSTLRGNDLWKANPQIRFTESVEPNLDEDLKCVIDVTGAKATTFVETIIQQRHRRYA